MNSVVQFLKARGPSLPAHVASHINTNVIMAGSILSELKSRGVVKISDIKIGGSPLYYLEGQEHQLARFLGNLNEKDRITAEKLQKEGIMRDVPLDALSRVSLRKLKDFARQLTVSHNGGEEIFWKWYLLKPETAKEKIGEILNPKKEEKKTEKKENLANQEKQEKFIEENQKNDYPSLQSVHKQDQNPLKLEDSAHEDSFLSQLEGLFAEKRITIQEQEKVRKSNEYNFVIQMESPLGPLTYFCKAKNKQKVNEGDLSAVLMQGQSRKLPALFLTTGKLTKKAQKMLANELKGMAVYEIGS